VLYVVILCVYVCMYVCVSVCVCVCVCVVRPLRSSIFVLLFEKLGGREKCVRLTGGKEGMTTLEAEGFRGIM